MIKYSEVKIKVIEKKMEKFMSFLRYLHIKNDRIAELKKVSKPIFNESDTNLFLS
jgi:hypothetical protein